MVADLHLVERMLRARLRDEGGCGSRRRRRARPSTGRRAPEFPCVLRDVDGVPAAPAQVEVLVEEVGGSGFDRSSGNSSQYDASDLVGRRAATGTRDPP
ncbi:hypothetical protein GS436_04485 [Rhodococcus hoagii]|nr:hypothetical protein [Prescottella equi]